MSEKETRNTLTEKEFDAVYRVLEKVRAYIRRYNRNLALEGVNDIECRLRLLEDGAVANEAIVNELFTQNRNAS